MVAVSLPMDSTLSYHPRMVVSGSLESPECPQSVLELIERIFSLHRLVERAKTPTDKTVIERQIDQLVYELYELTDDEIRIVEEQTS